MRTLSPGRAGRLRRVTRPVGAPAELHPGAARRLQLDVGRRLDGLLQGDHLGLLPGPGSEPAEARRYVPGDDVRRIDWAVTARVQEVHVRDAIAERELETHLVLDLGGSMCFGTTRWEKRELAISVAAAFAHLASGPGDRVGAVVNAPDGLRRLPPRSSRESVLALLHALLAVPRGHAPGPGLSAALRAVNEPPRRRGLAVVVSDLSEPKEQWRQPLARLAQRHNVIVVEVVDPRELFLPDVGVLRLVDPQTGQQVEVQTRSKALRQSYAAAAAERRAEHRTQVRAAGAGHVLLRTDTDWLALLGRYLQTRRRTRGVVR